MAFLLCRLRVLRSAVLWLAVLGLSAAVVALVRHDCGTFCKLSALSAWWEVVESDARVKRVQDVRCEVMMEREYATTRIGYRLQGGVL